MNQHPMAWVDSQARAMNFHASLDIEKSEHETTLCQLCLMPEHEGECDPINAIIGLAIKDAIKARKA